MERVHRPGMSDGEGDSVYIMLFDVYREIRHIVGVYRTEETAVWAREKWIAGDVPTETSLQDWIQEQLQSYPHLLRIVEHPVEDDRCQYKRPSDDNEKRGIK